MKITFDPAKRAAILATRGLDVADAAQVFAGAAATWRDDRFDYGEARWLTVGFLDGRVVLLAWTQRGASRRVISMRLCHGKEIRKLRRRFPEAFGEENGPR